MTTIEDVRQAADRIRSFVHRTPVVTNSMIDEMLGAHLFFKCENLQKVGAFKARGASNAVFQLPEHLVRRGVATHSSGNHAQALAYAARLRGVPCTVVMPDTSPTIKVEATKGYGAYIVFCENTLRARETTLDAVVTQTGATVIHPYDNEFVIAGQGTAALELLESIPDLDLLMAPIGGGGLMSGTAIAARGLNPTIQILGAEPEIAADAKLSLETNVLQPPYPPLTIADGLRTALCERTYRYLQAHDVRVLTATEDRIRETMRLLMARTKLVVEPSGAVPLAALFENPHVVSNMRVGVILSGGNVDLGACW